MLENKMSLEFFPIVGNNSQCNLHILWTLIIHCFSRQHSRQQTYNAIGVIIYSLYQCLFYGILTGGANQEKGRAFYPKGHTVNLTENCHLGKNSGNQGKNYAMYSKNSASLGKNSGHQGKNSGHQGNNNGHLGKNYAALLVQV